MLASVFISNPINRISHPLLLKYMPKAVVFYIILKKSKFLLFYVLQIRFLKFLVFFFAFMSPEKYFLI